MDKIANGQDDESWIGQLYNQFSTNLGIDGGKIDDADIGSMDGLEPPAVDEKWGLEDIRKLHEPEGKIFLHSYLYRLKFFWTLHFGFLREPWLGQALALTCLAQSFRVF